mmetsp:Transcript_6694/g.17022  ORF Transcript_6694/g.17022 Transcript_6694/m.17022 type:complete len:334 (-) Transcript_6694:1230-2231(-)
MRTIRGVVIHTVKGLRLWAGARWAGSHAKDLGTRKAGRPVRGSTAGTNTLQPACLASRKQGQSGMVPEPEGQDRVTMNETASTRSGVGQRSVPIDKLGAVRCNSRMPVVLLGCGAFNPPHALHVKMFDIAKEALERTDKYSVVGAYMSPVSDGYTKPGLLSAEHRIRMCKLAAEHSSIVMVDRWEADQPSWTRTRVVLNSLRERIAQATGGRVAPRVMLVCGSDLIETFKVPGLWEAQDLESFVFDHGIVCISRCGYDAEPTLRSIPALNQRSRSGNGNSKGGEEKRVHVVENDVLSDLSSTKIREALRERQPVSGLVTPAVEVYIDQNGLYR